MPATAKVKAQAEPEQAQSAGSEAALEVTGQLLMFEPGLYAVTLTQTVTAVPRHGFVLPSVRLDPVPPIAGAGRAFATVLSDGGWLSREGEPSFVRAVGGRAAIMLTIYKARGGMPSPELRIRAISDAGARELDGRPQPGTSKAPAPEPEALASALPLVIAAHVRSVGDVSVPAGAWAGQVGSGNWIEGFSIAGVEHDGLEFEYQATLGEQWTTPWFEAGEFCGSRGISLPLLGLRVRLLGTTAEQFGCRYWGSFVGKGITGPFSDGELCDSAGAELEALRVVLVPRTAGDADRAGDAAADADTEAVPAKRRRAGRSRSKPV